MKRILTFLLASLVMLTSCDKVFDIVVTQQDIVGTWDFYIAEGGWGRITIDRYGNCDVCYMGYLTVASDPEDYSYESGTIKVSSSKVTIDIPSWPSGTYKIRKSHKVNNRYLIDALRYAPADAVRIELNTGVSPAIIVPVDGQDNFLYMVLPVRLKASE